MLNSDKTKYLPKGTFTFAYIDDQIKFFAEDYPEHVREMYERRICGDMMSGKDFYEDVDGGGILIMMASSEKSM